MGNQLAAATVVNVSDVTSSLELVAPLSCEHRNYFRSFLCSKDASATVPSDTLRSLYSIPHNGQREHTAPSLRQSNRAGSTELVLKVFVRTLYKEEEQQLVEFCYNHLLEIDRRMVSGRSPAVQSPGPCGNTVSRDALDGTDSSGCSTGGAPSPCNVLFYSCMEIQNDRFCMLQRPYVAFSLAERLATRPYWNTINRLFAAYQLLQGMLQLHEVWRTVHGDLKAENVLVDSSGWLYVTDICPFNPALLPANNPALFDYFYNTNESHICPLAPEKFVDHPTQVNISNLNATVHTPGMDVFSVACVLVYIFTEEPLFHLSEVLELRSLPTQKDREAMVDKILQERGLHVNLRRMLLDMLCTDAASRPTVRQVLQRYTPAVFPAYFDYLYRDVLPVLLPRPPEHQVQLLWSRIGDIWSEVERLGAAKGCGGSSSSGSESSPLVPPSDAKKAAVLVLIPIVVNACLHLMTSEASCRVISIIHRMLPHCPVEVQANTLLPYVLHCVKLNSLPVVTRALALRTISAMCHAIPFSASEATVFDDLILPCVCDIVTKADTHNVTLLLEVANQLPSLLLQARSFLEHRQVLTLASKQENSFGQQLGKLLDNGWDALLTLYKHSHSAVVIAMLQQTKRVVKFLGEERTQHDFIPFLTTAIVSTVDVQRELYPQAILCHLSMQSPSLKTLSFFVEEALRQTDTIILHRALMGVSAIVGSKLFAVGDTMSLVQYALPYIVCADKWVRIAARRVVETAARTYRMSDVCTSLPRPLLPLLHQKTPLSSLTDLPSELVQEVSRHPFFADGQPQHNSQDGIRVIGGDAGLCGRVLAVVRNRDEERISEGRKAGGGSGVSCKLRYTIRHGTTKRFPPNLPQRAAFFDVSFDPALKDDSQDAKQGSPVATAFSASETARDEGTGLPSRSWKMTFKPTLREGRRMKLRQQVNLDGTSDNDTVVGDNSVSSPSFSADGKGKRQLLMTTACGGKFLSALSPGVLWAEKELAPVAAPYFTGRVHTGGIYGSAATPDGAGTCALVTVGSRGEARLWSVGATGVSEARRLDPGTKTNNTFLFVHFLRGGSDPLLCMGGTDGILRLCDVSKKSTVLERSLDGSPLTAACALGQDVLLTSSALGSLFVMDHRVGREVWAGRGVVPAELGVMSTISPLCSDCRAYGNVVTTTRGAIALFDLRFQMLLQQYHLCDVQKGGDRLLDSPHAILCATPDVTCKPPDQMNEHPGMFLGTQSGAVYHIDLLTGMSRVSLRPASTFDASTRAMLLQPKHSLLFTAGDDMQIRKWCLVNPTQSATLVSPPYSSHVYARRASGSVMEVRPPLRGAVKETTTSSSTAATAAGAGASSPRGVVVPQHHTDAILTLCAVGPVGAGETYLASGSRNGQLTLWFNTE